MLGPPPPRPGRCPGLGAPPGWWGAHGACRCLQRARHAWAGSQGAARMLGCWAAGQGCAPHAAAGRRRWRRWSCGGGGLAAGAREAGRLPFPPQRSASRPLMRARSGWRRTGRTRSSWWGRLAARRAALGSGTRLMGVRLVSSNHQAFMQQRACCRCSPPLHLQTSQLSEPELAQALAHESREAAAVSPQCMQGLFQVLAGQGESSRGTARVVARLQPMQHRRRAARHQHAGACRRPTPPAAGACRGCQRCLAGAGRHADRQEHSGGQGAGARDQRVSLAAGGVGRHGGRAGRPAVGGAELRFEAELCVGSWQCNTPAVKPGLGGLLERTQEGTRRRCPPAPAQPSPALDTASDGAELFPRTPPTMLRVSTRLGGALRASGSTPGLRAAVSTTACRAKFEDDHVRYLACICQLRRPCHLRRRRPPPCSAGAPPPLMPPRMRIALHRYPQVLLSEQEQVGAGQRQMLHADGLLLHTAVPPATPTLPLRPQGQILERLQDPQEVARVLAHMKTKSTFGDTMVGPGATRHCRCCSATCNRQAMLPCAPCMLAPPCPCPSAGGHHPAGEPGGAQGAAARPGCAAGVAAVPLLLNPWHACCPARTGRPRGSHGCPGPAEGAVRARPRA